MKQLIYKKYYERPLALPDISGFEFIAMWGMRDGLQNIEILFQHLRWQCIKDIIKLSTANRFYFCIVNGKKIVSEAYVTVGQCRYYDVEDNAAVIGPVWTDADSRGKGLATGLLTRTINALLEKGYSTIYTDTSENNKAMQNVIKKCGFGESIGFYEKA